MFSSVFVFYYRDNNGKVGDKGMGFYAIRDTTEDYVFVIFMVLNYRFDHLINYG